MTVTVEAVIRKYMKLREKRAMWAKKVRSHRAAWRNHRSFHSNSFVLSLYAGFFVRKVCFLLINIPIS